MIQDARDDEIHQVLYALRMAVEAGIGGLDDRTRMGEIEHVLQMDRRKWHFARG